MTNMITEQPGDPNRLHNNEKFNRILQTVSAIPPGTVASYGQVADLAGLPGRARLVSKALKSATAEQQIPWHRVLKSNGQLAFAQGSPEALQQIGLLQTENVLVSHHRVNIKTFLWRPDITELLFSLRF